MIRKTVIITGGMGDIGKATARVFAKNSYNIALTYLNSFDNDFLQELKQFGVDVLAIRCDQTNESDVSNFVNTVIKEFQTIDTLVACAGKAEEPELLTQKPSELIDEIIDVNLKGTILFNREVLKFFLKNKRGNIVNVSSIYGKSGGSLESVYSACKAGIIGLTKSLAVECSPFVRVNAVAPGCINTKMIKNLSRSDIDCVISSTPLERLGTPEDVASSIYFLSSDESSFITGEILSVTGGVERF